MLDYLIYVDYNNKEEILKSKKVSFGDNSIKHMKGRL